MHVYEVMAHPARRRLVEILALGPHAAWMLTESIELEFGIARTSVHHHLRVLRRAGLVAQRWESPDADPNLLNHEYLLEVELIERLDAELAVLLELWRIRLDQADAADPERREPALAPRTGGVHGAAPVRVRRPTGRVQAGSSSRSRRA